MIDRRFLVSRGLLLLLAITFLSASLPTAQAAVGRNQDLDNTLAEFDDGSFQLAASANYPTTSPAQGDQQGAVQLAPIAALKNMIPGTDLPQPVQSAGVVAIGRNVFVIGGNNGTTNLDTTYSSQIDLASGGTGAWNTDAALLPVKHSNQNPTTSISARTSPAAAAYATGQDSGFIYVIGGSTQLTVLSDFSSHSVLRGTVQNGRVTAWTSMPDLPPQLGPVGGVQQASAFVAQLPNGDVYLYVIGGLLRYTDAGQQSAGSSKILYTKLSGDGSFTAWTVNPTNIPLDPTEVGVWSSSVIGGNFTTASGQSQSIFYVIGGQTKINPATYTSKIRRADIAADGSVTFANASGASGSTASLGAAIAGHAAIQFRGSVYVAGGVQVGGLPSQEVRGSYIRDNATFPELGGDGSGIYFINRADGLPERRSGHGMVIVPFPATNPTAAYVYAIGGNDGSTGPQRRVFRTTINDVSSTEPDVRFPIEGWYVSKPGSFIFAEARLKRVYWRTDQTNGGNVELSYRLSLDTNCDLLGSQSEATNPWIPLGTGSINGENEVILSTNPANCFQYRARLTPNVLPSVAPNKTPYLLRIGFEIEIPGAVDLTATAFDFYRTPDQKIFAPKITLHNENIFLAGEPTLAADYGPDGPGSSPGSFFVDVFIYPPGATPPADHPIPTQPTTFSRLSIDVLRSELRTGPGGTGFDFVIPEDRPFCDYAIKFDTNACVERTLKELFPEAGTYTVVVVVDGDDNVTEDPTDAGKAESNNVFTTTVTVDPETISETPNNAYLPLISVP